MSRNEKEALDELKKDDTFDDENTYEKLSWNEDEHVLKGVKKNYTKILRMFY